MKRMIVFAWTIALLALSACNRATPMLPAPAAPNVEWAPLQAAAELEVKAIAPDAAIFQVSATNIDLTSSDVSQRLQFQYLTPDFKAITVVVRQEKGALRTTEFYTETLNVAVESSQREISKTDSPFPRTAEQLSEYQRRAAKVRLSPREAVIKALEKEQAVSPTQCSVVLVSLRFPRASDTPEWQILYACKPNLTIIYSIDAETGQLIDRTEGK